jgi:integrase
VFRENAKSLSETFKLAYELQIQCGLRATEAISFASHHIVRPDERRVYKCRIGTAVDGCMTKNDKIRTIEIPKKLMSDLYEYKLSSNRLKHAGSECLNEGRHPRDWVRLFLTNRGRPYARKALSNRFGDIRKSLRQSGLKFDYKDHDLRRTFATNWLSNEQQRTGNSFFYLGTKLMGLMGHADFKSTQKYVVYMNEQQEQIKQSHRVDEIATNLMS